MFTIGRGTEVAVAAVRCARAAGRRARPVDDADRRPGRVLAAARRRQPDALARPGEGRRAHGARRRSSTPSGICARRRAGKPLWKLLADLTPEELVALVDFRYLRDALTPERGAGDPARAPSRAAPSASASCATTATRPTRRRPAGSATTTTSCAGCAREAVADGFTHDQAEGRRRTSTTTVRRLRLAREAVGPDIRIAVDANQVWGVDRRRSNGCERSASSTRTGSRSRPPGRRARPRRDPRARSRRSRWRPASTATTA